MINQRHPELCDQEEYFKDLQRKSAISPMLAQRGILLPCKAESEDILHARG